MARVLTSRVFVDLDLVKVAAILPDPSSEHGYKLLLEEGACYDLVKSEAQLLLETLADRGGRNANREATAATER